MDIRIGDRVKYKNRLEDEIITMIVLGEFDINKLKNGCREIIKIERPHYEVVEEKKELLTEEERETLQDMLDNVRNFSCMPINLIAITDWNTRKVVRFYNNEQWISDIVTNLHFENIETTKEYTLKELGLEGN